MDAVQDWQETRGVEPRRGRGAVSGSRLQQTTHATTPVGQIGRLMGNERYQSATGWLFQLRLLATTVTTTTTTTRGIFLWLNPPYDDLCQASPSTGVVQKTTGDGTDVLCNSP